LSGLCIAIAAGVTRLAVAGFTLAWTHSVEKVEWQEDWRIEPGRLVLVESRIKGSGAGMEPGADAVLRDGWWSWRPNRAVTELALGDSGEAGQWRICAPDCTSLADPAHAPYRLRPCPP
jgi:hypothetical protein